MKVSDFPKKRTALNVITLLAVVPYFFSALRLCAYRREAATLPSPKQQYHEHTELNCLSSLIKSMTIVWLRLLYNISQCWKHVCGVMTVSREAEGRSKRSAQLSVPYIISSEQLSTVYLALVHNYNNKAKHRHGERHKNTMGTWRWLCTNKFIRVTGPFCSQHTISWRTWFLVRCHKQRNNPKKKNE